MAKLCLCSKAFVRSSGPIRGQMNLGPIWVCLKIVYPYTQWLCWSLSLLNGYFIGNIPHFQTNPFEFWVYPSVIQHGNWKFLMGVPMGGIFQQAMWDCLRVCNTSSIFKIEDKQSNLEVVYVPSKKKNIVVQKPFCRGFSTFWCLCKFTSGQVSLTFDVASSIFFTSPLKVVPISVTSAPDEPVWSEPPLKNSRKSSGIFWDHEYWVKGILGYFMLFHSKWKLTQKKRMNTRVIWEHRYISVFRWKIKKVSKPARHTSSRFGYFPTTVGYTTVRRLIFETLTTSSPLLLIFPEFLCEFTLTMLVWHSSLQGHRLVFDFIEFYNSIRRHFELHRRRFAVTQGQKLWQIISCG